MYIPSSFLCENLSVIKDWLKETSFGLFQTIDEQGELFITALPFLLREDEEQLVFEGHIAKANPQSEVIFRAVSNHLVVLGAHGYVSSRVYGHVNVPTYNYQLAHLTGRIVQLNDNQLVVHLTDVVNAFEKNRSNPLHWNEWPKQLLDAYLTEIIGFQFVVDKAEVAFKLSQNRTKEDIDAILTDLSSGNYVSKQLAETMKKYCVK